jgi:VanZ family protein
VLLRWSSLIVYAVVLFLVSSRPLPEMPLPPIWHLDKVVHAGAYALLAMLCFRAFRGDSDAPTPMWVLLLGVVIATLYGAAQEFYQDTVPYRTFDWIDLISNGVGACIAAVAWEPLTARHRWLR